jgi:hypothetical protein
MLISFYHLSLCPRCGRARKHLQDLLGHAYAASVREINIASNPLETWRNGVRIVPAVTYGDDLISGVVLSRKLLSQFLRRNNFLNPEN